mmetsp:Transcript_6154/g.14322  ORF Transcript_6154/g.14322 Transcript_6154/m.14322 type:complete len:205 (+) Transcript_6154:947-1561(+)
MPQHPAARSHPHRGRCSGGRGAGGCAASVLATRSPQLLAQFAARRWRNGAGNGSRRLRLTHTPGRELQLVLGRGRERACARSRTLFLAHAPPPRRQRLCRRRRALLRPQQHPDARLLGLVRRPAPPCERLPRGLAAPALPGAHSPRSQLLLGARGGRHGRDRRGTGGGHSSGVAGSRRTGSGGERLQRSWPRLCASAWRCGGCG